MIKSCFTQRLCRRGFDIVEDSEGIAGVTCQSSPSSTINTEKYCTLLGGRDCFVLSILKL